jgi:molybdate transport system substrate-binding protein
VKRRPAAGVAAVVATLALLAAGCGGGSDGGDSAGTLTVLAAASLTESFTALGRMFEAEHPGVEVTFNFAGSSALVRQLTDGAPGDVLATADQPSMQRAVDAGAVVEPAVFARNRLEIIVAEGNPKMIRRLGDLARPGLVVVLCAPEVPCGSLAAEALQRSGVAVLPSSVEENVKGVVSRVTLGEADAGIVYATDVRAAGSAADGVAIGDEGDVVADYPVARTARPENPAAARAWIDLLLAAEGRRTLTDFGFLAP